MAEGLTRSPLRTPQRALGTESGRMYREARKLERKGFSGAAQQVAAAAAQQKLADERPGFLSADTAIEEQKLRMQAGKQGAALASGMRPQDSRRGLFEDIRAAAGGGIAGAEGEKQLAGFRSRATQLGVTPEAFDRTVGGKLGVALPATATSTDTPATATPAAPTTTPTEILRGARNLATVSPFPEQKKAAELGVLGGIPEFAAAVRSAGGFRSDAVAALNKERVAAGKPEVKPEAVYGMLLAQDRSVSARTAGPTPSSNPLYGAAGPALPPTPAFGATGPALPIGPALPRTPLPAATTAAPAAPSAPAAAAASNMPVSRKIEGSKLTVRPYGNQFREKDVMTGEQIMSALGKPISPVTGFLNKVGQKIGTYVEKTAQENRAKDKEQLLKEARATRAKK